jgi:hypothetical protein
VALKEIKYQLHESQPRVKREVERKERIQLGELFIATSSEHLTDKTVEFGASKCRWQRRKLKCWAKKEKH